MLPCLSECLLLDYSTMCTCECIPSLLRVFVSKGQDVGGSATAITHHHRDWRSVPEVLQHYGDHIGTSLHNQSHHRHTLTNTCTRIEWEQEKQDDVKIAERKTWPSKFRLRGQKSKGGEDKLRMEK